MKRLLIALLLTTVLNAHAQTWIKYKFDENVTLSMPENFEMVDTLGTHSVKAFIENGLVVIQNLPNEGATATTILNKEELLESYRGFQKGVVEVQHGTLLNQSFELRNGLQVTTFSFTAMMGGEKQIRHYLVIFLNEHWYTITFWEVADLTNELRPLREDFFQSLELPPGLSLQNQLSTNPEGSQSYKEGYLIGNILGYVAVIGIVGLAIYMVFRRWRRQK